MHITKKQKRIILIALGIIIVLLILLFVFKGFKAKEFEITFDTNGGSNISSLIVKKEGKITKPEDPTKEGYIFEGWYYNDKKFDFNTEISKDMKLEAKWTKLEVTSISLNAQSLILKPDGIAALKVLFTPSQAKSDLLWESSDESIVTVSNDGEIKALKIGEATITVTTKDGKYKDTCKITVKDDVISVTGVSISGNNEVTVGSTIRLTANINPSNATNKEVIWKSSNTNIATVDSKGNVKGLKSGKVKITVTTVDGEKEATKEITIKEKSSTTPNTTPSSGGSKTPSTGGNSGGNTNPTPSTSDLNVKVTGVTLSGANSVNVNSTIQLNVTINPSNATNKKYTCTGDNSNVAEVTADCKVTGKDDGEVTVTVTTEDGKHTAIHKVAVQSIYSITFKRIRNDHNDITGYTVIINRNGKSWKDYKSIYYNNNYETYDNNTALASDVDENISTATIYLQNGKSVQVNILYID